MTFSSCSRGAVAVLIAAMAAAPLSAQTAGAVVRRDSVIVRLIGPNGKLDTMIMRSLEREPYGSEKWNAITKRLDSVLFSDGVGTARFHVMVGARQPLFTGWTGFIAQGPMSVFADSASYRVKYLAYPSILSIDPDSPAERAGMAPGDLVVAFNGTNVIGREFDLRRLFVPDSKLGVTVRRDGENKEFSLDLVKAPESVMKRRIEFQREPMPPGMKQLDERMEEPFRRGTIVAVPKAGALPTRRPALLVNGFSLLTPHGALGATMSDVGPELAKVLRIERGVLVNEVPEQSPAFKSGLRVGDVIVNANGQPVTTYSEVQDALVAHLGDRSLVLQVVRDRRPLKLTASW